MEERLATQLEAIVSKRLETDQLVLPALPAAAVKCLTLTKQADFALGDAAAIIDKDPILAAQLIKLASSAALGAREPIKSVLASVTRIGVQRLREFLIEASARQLFASRDRRISEAMQRLWDHARVVAQLARELVAASQSGDPDMGYLAGLLHDIGKPVVAALLLETERSWLATRKGAQWITGAQWVSVLGRCHQKVGLAIAEKWEMPDPVRRAVRDCAAYEQDDRLSVANCVRLANAIAKQEGIYVGEIAKDDVAALVSAGRELLNVDEQVVSRLTAAIPAMLKDT
ncbi:MAG TPA: HDOD domain-containing protein [Polyangia bacterium]|nr:HDOD domain-containing protein [Polyangia bacterium]